MKLVIVGGVAGGASAATRARRLREDAQIVVFERGAYVSFANCGLPYHIGGEIERRESLLVARPELLEGRFRIDLRLKTEVTAIDRTRGEVEARERESGRTYRESYDRLILAPGAGPSIPPIPGVDGRRIHTLWTIPDMDAIDLAIAKKAESAVVVGGGFVGIEAAEALRARGLRVTLVEKAPKVLPPLDPEMAETVHHLLHQHGVELILGRGVAAIRDDEDRKCLSLEGGDEIFADLVVLAVGVRPRAELARDAGLEIGDLGGIRVDDRLRTSDPRIFAVGDAIEVTDIVTGRPTLCPLAGPANRQGRIAADNAIGRDVRYRGAQGTFIIKVFGGTAAATGANEARLGAAGLPYRKIHIVGQSHAPYYPGAESMFVKLLFAPEGGRILGAQIVGGAGVDKRIDVLAAAIRANQTVFD
ncbi:MAG: FAD-dependent oxidoreductase, partial [Planctomycetes bacterium]|nr:FAD-dependent oxidoreductase [Planctomycetota bacterium]